MSKLVVLKFSGCIDKGFTVTSSIGAEGQAVERGQVGTLPPATELSVCLADWQQEYNQLGMPSRIKPQQIIYDGAINHRFRLTKLAKKLRQTLERWLNSPSFSPVDKHLREALNQEEVIRILICSDHPKIYQLPWCCWDLVASYPLLEIAYGSPNFAKVGVPSQPQHKVRILAILGDAQGIDIEGDRSFLRDITDAEVEFLVEPTLRKLNQCLWQKTWDIVFFAGHSKTQEGQGVLHLNAQERLTINQLSYGFKQAIASGLQLAIFNSCDGLGLAEELGRLSLPQSIVMRMPIPDQMAQEFMKYFLQAYANGNSLYLAMRRAREQLQGWERQFPCASWLPIIYQNPAVVPPNWSDLQTKTSFASHLTKSNILQLSLSRVILITALSIGLIWLVQSWGWLETAELNAYDRFMSWRVFPPGSERVLVVTIDEADIAYQKQQNFQLRGSLADAALDKLVNKLQLGQAKAIAFDIIHDFPFEAELAQTIAQTKNFVGICRIKADRPDKSKLISIAPPHQLEPQKLGFSNWAVDRDDTVRRQVLGMSPDDTCQTDISLSLRLAMYYLGDVPAGFDSQGKLKLGNTIFHRLEADSGGYHLSDAGGYQILLNYRQAPPSTVSLREILSMSQEEINPLVKNKAVLIGVKGHNNDLHPTPYRQRGQKLELPGVMIHALMTSQIIDTVLEERKPLGWASEKMELLWLAAWSLWGSTLIFIGKSSLVRISFKVFASLTLLFACCWLLFLNHIWFLTIAPALGLLLSASLVAFYSRR